MKLYYSPGACSLAPHIALRESGLAFTPVLTSTKSHKLLDGTDYYSINPLGYVPLLELDDGTRISEVPAILQYIADQVPARGLAPVNGTLARTKLQSWLTFVGTELHKSFSPLFMAAMPAEGKALYAERLKGRLAWVDSQLAGKDYLMGQDFTVADTYLYTVTNWCKAVGVDIAGLAQLDAYRERVAARPAVLEAMKTEGLLK